MSRGLLTSMCAHQWEGHSSNPFSAKKMLLYKQNCEENKSGEYKKNSGALLEMLIKSSGRSDNVF